MKISLEEEFEEQTPEIPDVVPVLPLKETVVFPEALTPLAIGQERSVRLIDDILAGDKLVGLVTVKSAGVEVPGPEDLYAVGTVAVVHKMFKVPDGTLRIMVQGLKRIQVGEFTVTEPYLQARVHILEDEFKPTKEVEALSRNLTSTYGKIISLVPYLPEELQVAAANIEDPSALAYLIASTVRLKTEEKQALLEEVNVERRLRQLLVVLNRELEVFELGSKIQSQVKGEMDKAQREYFLRQQLKAIQEELGETDPAAAEVNELRAKVDELDLPEDVDRAARRELDRLAKLPPAAAEYSVIRSYLDWIITLPWRISTPDNLDISRAQEILDEDHYDLEKVKERILEYLSVGKLTENITGPILCFVGPPGVGKTSLGQSVARALERKFIRMSVGGVRDEAEIRGHRRTYIGALPGTIVRSIRDAASNNPVFMIDEVDKIGVDFRGDPASALLEVLDPEQNKNFRDHYMDLPFDLSKVLFITTANQLEPVPPALKDRMEVIRIAGYTEEEKLHITQRYLVPKQLKANGLNAEDISFGEDAIRAIIRDYTREAGVRNLERSIAGVCRKIAREVVEKGPQKKAVTAEMVTEFLGKKPFFYEIKRRTSEPGVATGLAWTQEGGDIIFVESTAYPGNGNLTLTGQLGDVMRESAQAAHSYVRTRAKELGIDPEFFRKNDIHIHVPAGAIPKDGPSAGVTMATSLASLALGRPVNSELAMTGEITLTGKVLPVGGVKEKVLAARRAGLTTVVLPRRNERDLDDVPEHLRKKMTFVPADAVNDVFEVALAIAAAKPVAVKPAAAETREAGVPALGRSPSP